MGTCPLLGGMVTYPMMVNDVRGRLSLREGNPPLRHGIRYSLADRFIMHLDWGVRTMFGSPPTTGRPDPAEGLPESSLSPSEKKKVARLMRVNHAGEIAAQALYQGQALTARDPETKAKLERAAREENDHLAWCRKRVEALGERTSRLNPFWYLGSLAIGTSAGLLGDRFNLGFLAETERQVVEHLERHLAILPEDPKSRAVIERMKEDEARHGQTAEGLGAARLPAPIRRLMGLASRVMTGTAYWI